MSKRAAGRSVLASAAAQVNTSSVKCRPEACTTQSFGLTQVHRPAIYAVEGCAGSLFNGVFMNMLLHSNASIQSCAITLIRLPHCLPLTLYCNISVVQGVDLLHLMAPLVPGREQCSPTGCQPDQLECLLSSKPTHTRRHAKLRG